jgi:hypothetical protein
MLLRRAQNRGAYAPGGAPAFTPASLSNVVFWGEARAANFQLNAGTTAAGANSDPVGYFTDLSGAGHHYKSLADNGTRPLLQGVGVNPYLDFDGTDDILTLATSLGIYAAGSCSVFFAIKGNPGLTKVLFGEASSSSAAPIYDPFLSSNGTASTATSFYRNNANTTVVNVNGMTRTLAFNNADRVYGVTDDGANWTPYLDGVVGTALAYTRSATTVDRSYIGGRYNNGAAGSFFAARVYGMVAVTGVLGGTDRANLVTYLGTLAGLTL